MCSKYQCIKKHVLPRIEGNAEHKAVRFDVVLVDGPFVPRRVHGLGVVLAKVSTLINETNEWLCIWLARSWQSFTNRIDRIRLTDRASPENGEYGRPIGAAPIEWRQTTTSLRTSGSLAWDDSKAQKGLCQQSMYLQWNRGGGPDGKQSVVSVVCVLCVCEYNVEE